MSSAMTRMFDFIYDESGKPFACKYTVNGTSSVIIYYVLNLQGDVVRILNSSGSTLVKYTYNAWGEVISVTDGNDVPITNASHIGNLNPLRYRGYYYDTETGFYYLQSRYYDPTMHRFINADSLASTGQGVTGTNMFAYCLNNPLIYSDPLGTSAEGNLIYLFLYYALWEDCDSYDFTGTETGERISHVLQSSNTMKAFIKEHLKMANGQLNYSADDELSPYNYRNDTAFDFEMAYSMGDVEITFSYKVRYCGNRYTVIVNYTITDSYTFEEWRGTKGNKFTQFVNNAGYYASELKLLTEYEWTFSGCYYYHIPTTPYEKCTTK